MRSTGKRRGATIAATLLVGAGVVVGLPATANAAMSDCPAGSFCAWEAENYGQTRMGATIASSNWDYIGNPSAWKALNDDDDSTYNRWETKSVSIFEHDSYIGYRLCTSVGSSRSSYTFADDQGSSHKNDNGSGSC